MAATMKASFALNLGGDLKAELKKVTEEVVNLKNAGKQVALEKLERLPGIMNDAGDAIRQTIREVGSLASEMRRVEGSAERAGGAMGRMASVGHRMANVGRGVAGFGKRMMGSGGLIGAAQAVGGAYAIYAPTTAYASFENINRQSAITKGFSGRAAGREAARLGRIENADAIDTGQSSISIEHTYQDLLHSGIDPARAQALLPIHSRAATAYSISSDVLTPATRALTNNFQIQPSEMAGAMAAMALASKSGLFKIQDFSNYLPAIGGDYQLLSMTGREAANRAFASLEIVTKNAKDPMQGEANYNDFLKALTLPHSVRTFRLNNRGMDPLLRAEFQKYHVRGINLPKLKEDAARKGIDIQTAVLAALHESTDNLPAFVRADVLSAMLGGQNAGSAAQTLLLNPGALEDLLKHLRTADAGMLDRDFNTAKASPKVTNDIGAEVGEQLERRIGEGFEPIMTRLTEAGKSLLGFVGDLDTKFPGLANAVLAVTGAMLAAATALGAVGFVAPAIGRGVSMLRGAVAGATPFALEAMPVAIPAALTLGVLKVGSDAETPANEAALEKLHRDQREGAILTPQDGYGPDGRPINLAPPTTDNHAPAGGHPISLDLTVHTDSGTSVRLNQSSGAAVKLNPGATTALP